MKIVLLGYMASGKSAVGQLLATELQFNFIDLDAYIELKEEKTVSEIFAKNGEIYFRLKEAEYLTELLNSTNNFVLSVGGGTPCYANNIDVITDKSQSFYLRASLNTLFNRLQKEKNLRPLVANLDTDKLKEFVAKHLFERIPFYEQSKFVVATDDKTIDEVISEISKKLI